MLQHEFARRLRDEKQQASVLFVAEGRSVVSSLFFSSVPSPQAAPRSTLVHVVRYRAIFAFAEGRFEKKKDRYPSYIFYWFHSTERGRSWGGGVLLQTGYPEVHGVLQLVNLQMLSLYNSWFSRDITKIQTTKLLIFLRFYFNDV